MRNKIYSIIWSCVSLVILYIVFYFILGFAIDSWVTNADSQEVTIDYIKEIPPSMRQVHKYIQENPEHKEEVLNAYTYLSGWSERFPSQIRAHDWFMFVLNWQDNRKLFSDTVYKYSELLSIDPDMVMASVLGEQVRIARWWTRGKLKNIILSWRPTMFRSYDVSLGIWGIKVSTANQIKRDAIKYWYWDELKYDVITDRRLTEDDEFNAKYATYLVKNIIHRWELEGHDISGMPGVIGTLYNMGNDKRKSPHATPQIGWTVVTLNWREFTYWGLVMGIYWYFKIYG